MNISIIGSGNVAFVFAQLLKPLHNIVQICSRNKQTGTELAHLVAANYIEDIRLIDPQIQCIIIAVQDEEIEQVATQIHLPHAVVIHTSGSTSIQVLQNCSNHIGVCWAAQSLRKQVKPLPALVLAATANTSYAQQVIEDLFKPIAFTFTMLNEDDRIKLHLAAVMASNFPNHIWALVQEYCEQQQLDFSLLHPIIIETAQRIQQYPPKLTQTGPAIRGDVKTEQKHIALLQPFSYLKNIYQTLSGSIHHMYKKINSSQ